MKIFIILLLCSNIYLLAQKNVDILKYNQAKDSLKIENYYSSAKLFGELYKQLDQKNQLSPYCYYYAAFCNYKMANYKEANFILFQLLSKFPTWEYVSKAYFLKGVVQFESKNYADAIIQLAKTDYLSKPESDKAKSYYFNKITSDTLVTLNAKFPNDDMILNTIKSKLPTPKLGKFNVAVLLPFDIAKQNSFVYELYSGIQIAVDSLQSIGLGIQLYPFVSGKDSVKIKEFVSNPNSTKFDLIVGPLYLTQQNLIAKFANINQINVVNPLSFFTTTATSNPNYFLFKSSYETQSKAAANYAYNTFTQKTVVIFYGLENGDSLMAKSYKKEYEAKGGKVLIYRKISKYTAGYFASIFNKVPLENVGHIFVASSESSLAANMYSHLEAVLLDQTSKYKDNRTDEEKELSKIYELKTIKRAVSDLPIIVPSSWLNFESISYEQYMLHNTHFIYPDYLDKDSIPNNSFYNNYIKKVGLYPTNYAYQGFDMMLYFGYNLCNYGRKFNENIRTQTPTKAYGMTYIDYFLENNNQYVPFVKIENFKLKLIR